MKPGNIRLTTEGKVKVLDLVLKDLTDRAEVGKERYGTYLETHNGRDALMDAYQEALDLSMYIRQAIEEKNKEHRTFCEVRKLKAGDHAGYQGPDFYGFSLLLVNGIPMIDGSGEPVLLSHDHADELADFWNDAARDLIEGSNLLAEAIMKADNAERVARSLFEGLRGEITEAIGFYDSESVAIVNLEALMLGISLPSHPEKPCGTIECKDCNPWWDGSNCTATWPKKETEK